MLVQVETVLIIANGVRVFQLAPDVQRGPVLVAIAILLLLTAGQIAVAIWGRAGDARRGLLSARRASEADLVLERLGHRTPGYDEDWFRRVEPAGGLFRLPTIGPLRRLRFDPRAINRARAWHIVDRFGLEPTWSYQALDELGNPAARRITHQARLMDARAAGDVVALLVAVAALLATLPLAFFNNLYVDVGVIPYHPSPLAFRIAMVVVLALIVLARAWSAAVAERAFTSQELTFYLQVERLLELHRFELYRALGLQAPRSSRDEREAGVAAWRLGEDDADVTYDMTGESASSAKSAAGSVELQQQVAGLAEALRGPELVPYDGVVSWRFGPDSVELAFGGDAVPGDGSERLEVAGSGIEDHAPFDVLANSDTVSLSKVREYVQAPVDGRIRRAKFQFTGQPPVDRELVVWFEISQRGRFVQLVRAVPSNRPVADRRGVERE